jgi:hypothetical protein
MFMGVSADGEAVAATINFRGYVGSGGSFGLSDAGTDGP